MRLALNMLLGDLKQPEDRMICLAGQRHRQRAVESIYGSVVCYVLPTKLSYLLGDVFWVNIGKYSMEHLGMIEQKY